MTFEKVVKIISEFKDIDANEVTLKTSLTEDLGLDSLDTVELIMSFEEEFGVTLELNENLKTIGDLVDAIDKGMEK